jgi:AcrR family transcriptional regulator
MDRRIQKTKDAIVKAFIELMSEKNFDQITINEISERANVNRGTVYLHYADKYGLLDQCIEDHLDRLFQSCLPDGGADHFTAKVSILRAFEYLEQNAFFYSTMLKNKGNLSFRNRLLSMIAQTLQEGIDKAGYHQDIKKDVLVQFLASAAVGVIEWWLTHSMPYPAKEMVEQFWLLLERMQVETTPKP